MQQNIEMSLQNVVKLEEIQDRTDDLSKQASVFKTKGEKLKNKMYWRNIKVCKVHFVKIKNHHL